LLVSCGALGAVAACGQLVGITDFVAAGEDTGAPPARDGSSSSGGESGSEGGSGSSGGSGSGSTSGSDGGGMPVIVFSGRAHGDNAGGASPTVGAALTWSQSKGDLIVVQVAYGIHVGQSPLAGYPQDTRGNTYVQIGTTISDTSGFFSLAMYACLNAEAASLNSNLVEFAVSTPESAADMSVEVFGATAPGSTWIPDQFSNARGSGTSGIAPGAVTTTYPNEFLVAADGVGYATTGDPSVPWNSEPVDGLGNVQSYYVASSTQVANPTYAQSPSSTWCAQIGTFAAKP
jgi:hypothetical protein